jgi:hypothetical protein
MILQGSNDISQVSADFKTDTNLEIISEVNSVDQIQSLNDKLKLELATLIDQLEMQLSRLQEKRAVKKQEDIALLQEIESKNIIL